MQVFYAESLRKLRTSYIGMYNISENLKALREKKGWSQAELAEKISISKSNIAAYEDGRAKPKIGTLEKLAEVFGISAQQLLFKKIAQSGKNVTRETLAEEGIPVYDLKASASGVEMYNDVGEQPAKFVTVPGLEDCDFGMYVHGSSMYPTIENGSLIVAKKITDKSIIAWGELYVVLTGDYRMVKRIQKSEIKECVICASDNEEHRKNGVKKYEPIEIPLDKIRDLYLVKGIVKKTQS